MRHLTAMRSGGGRLVVVDPRLTQTAKMADLHLQVTPGTDLALALGLLHIAIAEGYADADYLAARTTGFEDVRTSVSAWWPERVERVTGVPVARMREAVRILGEAERAMVLTGRGPSSTPRAPTRSPRSSTWRSPSGCPAVRAPATAA
ncbi:hypothetical protein GCM10027612_57140 [Microbispora bryophytorum subsp. camponoti]